MISLALDEVDATAVPAGAAELGVSSTPRPVEARRLPKDSSAGGQSDDPHRGNPIAAAAGAVQDPAAKALVAGITAADECDRESTHELVAVAFAPAA